MVDQGGGDLLTYLTPATLPAVVADISTDFLLLGHAHLSLHQRIGTVTVVDPGSVGLPRDSGGKASYAVYEEGTEDVLPWPRTTHHGVFW